MLARIREDEEAILDKARAVEARLMEADRLRREIAAAPRDAFLQTLIEPDLASRLPQLTEDE